ncbi:MAG: hypothetical protein NTZ09_20865 [Candidatus Hydrogenedentes bacterium]|nr:hypothetical protein [Candidatus Hydrogenedentota bacterium]
MLLLAPFSAWAAPADDAAPTDQTGSDSAAADEMGPWYFFNGSTNSHPRLHKADKLIDRQLNTPFRLIAPGFDDVKTFTDQANDFMIWSPFIGVGRKIGDHWDVFFQVGGSAGVVRTKSDDTSVLLLPFHADVTIKRSNLFIGPGVAWFPFGFPKNAPKMTWGERFHGTRPYLTATFSWNRMTYEGDVKAGLRPFGNFIQNKQEDTWHPFSSNLGAGVDVPLTKRTTLSLNGQWSFMYDYGEDFAGPNIGIFVKRAFGGPKKR